MSAEALRSEGIDEANASAKRPWRNPFVIAFVLGAVVLTVLPFVQRLALRAPPPLAPLGAWSLSDIEDGAAVDARALAGKAWLATFVPAPCDADCARALALFASAAPHVADLGSQVAMLALVQPGAEGVAREVRAQTGGGWRAVSGSAAALDPLWTRFAQGWDRQTHSLTERSIAFLARPTLAVVDQDGSVRGLWPADEEGRGHAINAVRMFARYGTEP